MKNIRMRPTGFEENPVQDRLRSRIPTNSEMCAAYGLNNGINQMGSAMDAAPPVFHALYREMMMNPSDFPHACSLQTIMMSGEPRFKPAVFPESVWESSPEELAKFLANCQLRMALLKAWQCFRKSLVQTDHEFGEALCSADENHRYLSRITRPHRRNDADRRVKLLVSGFRPLDRIRPDEEKKSVRHPFPEPAYGFVGRDMDVMGVEKRLLSKGNLLLHGMGGVGKSTLLHYLAAWWQTTGFVDQVFFFGYDEKPWTCREIVTEIAEKLLSHEYLNGRFHSFSHEEQRTVICEKLSQKRHLLILDHMESSEAERADLRGFLSELNHGETLVIIGSRNQERWMARKTFAENVYELSGLDPRSASQLAGAILDQHEAPHYHQHPDFQRLLELSDGHPLALEVMLPWLKTRKPGDILMDLGADQIASGNGDMKGKRERILASVAYVYASSFPLALLHCLAPFSGSLNMEGVKRYVKHLKEQPEMADTPLDLLPKVIQEGMTWKLISPHSEIPDAVRIDPVLSHFLRSRFAGEADSHGVETAFRRYYDSMGRAVRRLMRSQQADKRTLAHLLVRPEYENLSTALKLSLNAHEPIRNLWLVLSEYLDITRKPERKNEMGDRVLTALESYPRQEIEGERGAAYVEVISDIARSQLRFGRRSEAEAAYLKSLMIWLRNKHHRADQIRRTSASLYHQLGRVAQDQGEWDAAREYFLTDLEISKAYNDRRGMGLTLTNLFRVWMAGGDPRIPRAIADVMGWAHS